MTGQVYQGFYELNPSEETYFWIFTTSISGIL